jgi:ComF family protein
MESLRPLADGLLGLLFPDRCIGCKRSGVLLCPTCQAAMRPYSAVTIPRIGGAETSLLSASAAYQFEDPLRQAIHTLKYDRIQRIAPLLGDLLVNHLKKHPLPMDAVIPVPLHPHRMAERGFNQSSLLAGRIAEVYGVSLRTKGLVRTRDTAHQVGLDAQERRKNMQEAFVWRSKKAPPARVVLIDDVTTTGSTLIACAEVLRAAGAQEVRALALAHGS